MRAHAVATSRFMKSMRTKFATSVGGKMILYSEVIPSLKAARILKAYPKLGRGGWLNRNDLMGVLRKASTTIRQASSGVIFVVHSPGLNPGFNAPCRGTGVRLLMSKTWYIEKNEPDEAGELSSFIGGKPKLPPELPVPECEKCHFEMTFYFQLALERAGFWQDKSIAVFFCTKCSGPDTLFPKMLKGPLAGADIPEGFLTAYQSNFRIYAFLSADALERESYREVLRFCGLSFTKERGEEIFGTMGGQPHWLLGDESPRSYGQKQRPFFLFDVMEDQLFQVVDGAPKQQEVMLTGDIGDSIYDEYYLFNMNRCFFFGVEAEESLVYALTQCD